MQDTVRHSYFTKIRAKGQIKARMEDDINSGTHHARACRHFPTLLFHFSVSLSDRYECA